MNSTPTFEEAYAQFLEEIQATAVSQWVPGYEHDDIVSEMVACLWKACRTHQEGLPFAPYWWSLWHNRRVDLLERHFRQKRPRRVHATSEDHLLELDLFYDDVRCPIPPPTFTPLERMIWMMLGSGEQAMDIWAGMGMSRSKYHRIIRKWRNETIRSILRP